MANRHLARSIVLQTLFEWDFGKKSDKEADDILQRNIEEFASGVTDFSFMKTLLRNVLKKQSDIDKVIEKAAPDWPLEKISMTDRNILRIGLYELLFADRGEVPAKVAINEAIELAKTFGGETSGRFVNGVLGAVYKELGEPGKDDQPKKKKEVPYDEMPIIQKAGAVVWGKNKEGEVELAFVHDIFGHWTLSKGGIEEKEDIKDGVKRVINEEMGLDVEVGEELGTNEYVANHPEIGKHRKQVTYFMAEAKYKEPKLGESGGLDDVKWFKLNEIADLNFYDDVVGLVTATLEKVAK